MAQIKTKFIGSSQVTYAKIQNETASTLLGNPTGSAAAPSEITLGSGLSFSGSAITAVGASPTGNIAANDSNVTFTSSSNTIQYCTPTAARTYTMPASSVTSGLSWTIYNQATSAANYITLQTSGSNTITIIPPLGYATITPTSTTPTAASNWILNDRQSQSVSWTPTFAGFGTCTNINFYSSVSIDKLYIQGYFESGTPTTAIGTFSLPAGLTINGNKIYQTASGSSSPCVGTYTVQEQLGAMLTAYTTSSSLIYFSNYVANAYTVIAAEGTTVASGGSSNIFLFCTVPIN